MRGFSSMDIMAELVGSYWHACVGVIQRIGGKPNRQDLCLYLRFDKCWRTCKPTIELYYLDTD